MPPPRISPTLTQLRSLVLSGPSLTTPCLSHSIQTPKQTLRQFTTSRPSQNWLLPSQRPTRKQHKGRPQVNTGGSTRGTTVTWGSWGLRLASHDQRVKASHFRIAEETLKRRLKGTKNKIYTRIVCNVAVYTSGNDKRMGKGKGGFDYWASRIPHGRVVFEIGGEVHEHLVKDAFRLAGNKLPGQWEFVRKGDPPVVGTTKWKDEISKDELWNPRRTEPLHPLHKLPDGTKVADAISAPVVQAVV